MFYSTQILAKKGPLGLVWIAAHLDGRLKRQQINAASIGESVDTLLHPEAPLALRLSGQLLLGVVRIYQRKVNYLQKDCEEAVLKFKTALRAQNAAHGAGVDLPAGAETAAEDEITMTLPGGDAADVADYLWGGEQLLLGGRGGAGGLGGLGGSGALTLVPSGSGGRLSQDLSEVWGLHTSTEGEMFDMEGVNPDDPMPWDLDDVEVERLRAASQATAPEDGGGAGVGAGGALEGLTPASDARTRGKRAGSRPTMPFATDERDLAPEARAGEAPAPFDQEFDQPFDPFGADGDDMLPPPMGEEDEAAAAALAAEARRASGAGAGAGGGAGGAGLFDGAEGDAYDALPPTPAGDDGAGAAGGDEGAGVAAAAARARRAAAATARRAGREGGAKARAASRARGAAVAVDVRDGRAATQLDAGGIRALLADRRPLLKERGKRARRGGGAEDGLYLVLAWPASSAAGDADAAGPDQGDGDAFGVPGLRLGLPGLAFFSVGHGAAAAAALPRELRELGRRAAAGGAAPRGGGEEGGKGGEEGARAGPGAAPAGAAGAPAPGVTPSTAGGGDYAGDPMDFDQFDQPPEFDLGHPEEGAGAEGADAGGAGGGIEDAQQELERGGGEDEGDAAAAAATPGGARGEREPWPADAETLQELGDADDKEAAGAGAGGAAGGGGFTGRTRLVMRQLQRAAAAAAAPGSAAAAAAAAAVPASGSKRKRVAAPAPDGGDEGAACGGGGCGGGGGGGEVEVSLASLTRGRARLDACRWFYEMLVLQNRGLARLRQGAPYADIGVTPDARAMAAV